MLRFECKDLDVYYSLYINMYISRKHIVLTMSQALLVSLPILTDLVISTAL